MSRVLSSVLVIVACVAALAYAGPDQGSMHDCMSSAACKPWGQSNHACKRKSRMDLRFTLDRAPLRWDPEQNGTSGETKDTPGVPYFFCPVVDELQAFGLNHSAYQQLLTKGDTWDVSSDYSAFKGGSPPVNGSNVNAMHKYLNVTVFGMGSIPELESPKPEDDSWALVVENNCSQCPMLETGINATADLDLRNTRQSAVVNFLVLNITTTLGEYTYVSGFDQPIQSGFASTCDETDRCKLFDNGVCIGLKKGKKNCAKCVSSPAQVLDHSNNLDLKIWASYYGTDKTGRKMMSGSENPLSFTQFSAEPVFNKVGGELGGIERKF